MRMKLQHCIWEPISFLAPGIAPSQGKDLPLLLKQVIVLQKKCQIPHLPPLVCLEVVILTARSLLRASSHHQLSSWRTLRFLPTFLASDLHGREHYFLESPSKALTCPAVLCIIQLRQNLQKQPCSQKTQFSPQEAEGIRFCTVFSSLFLLYQTSAVHSQLDVSLGGCLRGITSNASVWRQTPV